MSEKQYLKIVGKRIKELRKSKGFAQNDFAYSCDFEAPSLARIEAGNTNPTLLTLLKIANELGISISELLDIKEELSSLK